MQEYGVEADDIALMNEAMTSQTEALILVMTEVDDHEELDTRLYNVTPFDNEEDNEEDDLTDISPLADAVLDQVSEQG